MAKPSIGSPPYREKEREKERCYKNHPQSINLANVAPLNITAGVATALAAAAAAVAEATITSSSSSSTHRT